MRNFTTYPGRDALLRHTQVGTQFNDIPGSRLGSNRMETHQNLHTHAVDSAIQLQGNNRVLKKCPPPISDEEQRLNQRQRCTLSQLRSGHCHQLQDYKHRVFGEPSDICTDCGASPQDVRHLFACTNTRLTCHQRIYGGIR